jgi:predicted RNase H-like nuclease (RuvC/YqgF family)
MSDKYVPTSIVCDHGRLRRQCADCEVSELYKQLEAQDKRIAELSADIKNLESSGEEYEEKLTELNEAVCRQQDELDKDEKVSDLRVVIDSQAKEIVRLETKYYTDMNNYRSNVQTRQDEHDRQIIKQQRQLELAVKALEKIARADDSALIEKPHEMAGIASTSLSSIQHLSGGTP